MEQKTRRRAVLPALLVLVAVVITAGVIGVRHKSVRTPPPSALIENDSAQMQTRRLNDGIVSLCYVGGKGVWVKAQIAKEDGIAYNYDLDRNGAWETFTFTQGDGQYTVKVLENTTENRYQAVFTANVAVTLSNPLSPFLTSNQFIHYTSNSEAAKVADQIMAEGTTDAEKAALAFDYVVDALLYDQEKANAVQAGYLPDVDAILARGKGICFDYAALLCAMLRSQGIPCKLMMGYSGKVYHAWVEVYCQNDGLINGAIPITGGEWSLLDPTFVSGNARSETILRYVTNPANYDVRYVY